jgi:hypothetical protein
VACRAADIIEQVEAERREDHEVSVNVVSPVIRELGCFEDEESCRPCP